MSQYVLVRDHPMKTIRIEKVVVNMAVGESGEKLAKAAKVLEQITGQKPKLIKAKKTIRDFGIRKGENIACMVTLRKEKAINFLLKALQTIDYKIKEKSIADNSFSFGVPEHIYFPGVKYDPSIGIFGFDVIVVFERPGFRVKRRRRRRNKVGKKHLVTKKDIIEFLEKILGVKVVK
ncbi:MAG: 50S ribosomal protein L5 [Candidatus Njordarchaeum guaymaensis]|nr:MAG: 50S ribosomal protein L5 [Thermoprotei archaeon]